MNMIRKLNVKEWVRVCHIISYYWIQKLNVAIKTDNAKITKLALNKSAELQLLVEQHVPNAVHKLNCKVELSIIMDPTVEPPKEPSVIGAAVPWATPVTGTGTVWTELAAAINAGRQPLSPDTNGCLTIAVAP